MILPWSYEWRCKWFWGTVTSGYTMCVYFLLPLSLDKLISNHTAPKVPLRYIYIYIYIYTLLTVTSFTGCTCLSFRLQCSAPRVWVFRRLLWHSTAHARNRSTTYSDQSTSVPHLIHVCSTTRQTQRRPDGGQFNHQLTQSSLSLDPCVNQVQHVYKTTEGKD